MQPRRPNLENFPFDTQTCDLKFESWSYDTDYLKMLVMPKGFAGEAPSVNEYTMREMVATIATDTNYEAMNKKFSSLSVKIETPQPGKSGHLVISQVTIYT